MKVVIDTNVLFSSLLFPSPRMRGLMDNLRNNHEVFVFGYVASELLEVTSRKKPASVPIVQSFLDSVNLVADDAGTASSPALMRDQKDQPILDSAIAVDADIILTGDKDFTSLEIGRPRIMTPSEFIAEFM